MSDHAPYLEQTDTRPNGEQVHAIHNLTERHIDLFRKLLRRERTNLTVLISETEAKATPVPMVTNGLRQQATEIDELVLHLYHIRP
jgi:hypothetical protein